MKTRVYCITTGQYSSYRVVAHVEGPATPVLSTLLERFRAEYGVVSYAEPAISFQVMSERIERGTAAQSRLREAGYDGDTSAEQFVSWLKRHHGFVDAKVTMEHV